MNYDSTSQVKAYTRDMLAAVETLNEPTGQLVSRDSQLASWIASCARMESKNALVNSRLHAALEVAVDALRK